mgnify:CR=1 FL=1
MVGNWNFYVKKTNTRIIFQDNSEEKWWVKRLCVYLCYYELQNQTLLAHLRNLMFHLGDGRFEYNVSLENVKNNLVPPMTAYPDGSIMIRVPVWRIYQSLYGMSKVRTMMRDALTHELVHSLHFSINPSLSKTARAMNKLRLAYLQSGKEFAVPMLPHIHMEGFLSAFVYQVTLEGFSELFPKLIHYNLEFTEDTFKKNYAIALQNIEVGKKFFAQVKTIKDRNDPRLNNLMMNFLNIRYQKLYYSTGYHIVYTILYLQNED